MKKFASIFCWYLLFSLTFIQIASSAEKLSEPEVEITPPRRYYLKKVFFFPLELPSYLLKGLTAPVGAAGYFMEKHHLYEKTLDLLSNDEKTSWIYPVLELGTGPNLGGGIGTHHSNLFHKGYRLTGKAILYHEWGYKLEAKFGDPHFMSIKNHPLSYEIKIRFQRHPDEKFYGFGNNSLESNRSKYKLRDLVAGPELTYEIISHLNASFEFLVEEGKTTPTSNTQLPHVEDVFPASSLVGFNQRLTYITMAFHLNYDTRDNTVSPQKGGIHQVTFRRFQCLNRSGFDFNEYKLKLTRFFPLGLHRRVFILHSAWTFQQQTGSSQIPFYYLAPLDVHSPLRAFPYRRFVDRNTAVFNMEYRFPVWNIVDGSIFVDTGRTFTKFTDFAFADFKYSAGGGLRFIVNKYFLARFETAYGNDGIKFIFSMSQAL